MFLAACSSNGGSGSSAGGAGAPGFDGSTSSTGGSGGGTEDDATVGRLQDCSGQLSGPIVATIGRCSQTTSVNTDATTGMVVSVTHGFIAYAGQLQVAAVFSFKQEPPSAGTYDGSDLAEYEATVGAILYGAPSPGGSLTLNLSGVNGSKLTGTLDAVMPPVNAIFTDAGPGNEILHLAFP
jgi:hypothetical protein